jgi:hypothetical protein
MPITLATADAIELAETLELIRHWLGHDRGRLGDSLEEFIGNRAYSITELREDLARLTFLLGGDEVAFLGSEHDF